MEFPEIRVNGKLVRHILLELDITQAELARRGEMSQGTVVNALNGKTNTDLRTVARIAWVIGRNPVDILITEGFPPPQEGFPAPQLEAQATLAPQVAV